MNIVCYLKMNLQNNYMFTTGSKNQSPNNFFYYEISLEIFLNVFFFCLTIPILTSTTVVDAYFCLKSMKNVLYMGTMIQYSSESLIKLFKNIQNHFLLDWKTECVHTEIQRSSSGNVREWSKSKSTILNCIKL